PGSLPPLPPRRSSALGLVAHAFAELAALVARIAFLRARSGGFSCLGRRTRRAWCAAAGRGTALAGLGRLGRPRGQPAGAQAPAQIGRAHVGTPVTRKA